MRLDKYRKPKDSHGQSSTPLYHRWTSIVSRVNDPDNACYKNYGGRGISICDEWRDYLKFKEWALNNGYVPDKVIDRIDVNGDYCPKNCTWVTKSESSINRRKGELHCIQKNYNRYQVTIVRKRIHYYLGTFATIEECKEVRDSFLKSYNNNLELAYKSANKHI